MACGGLVQMEKCGEKVALGRREGSKHSIKATGSDPSAQNTQIVMAVQILGIFRPGLKDFHLRFKDL